MTTLLKTTQELLDGRIEQTYLAWQEGAIQSEQTLNDFCEIIGPVQDQIKLLKWTDDRARAYISEVVDYLGGSAEVSGFGELKITNPSVTYYYDKKAVDRLTNELRTEGLGDVAARLDACLKPSEKVGSLRITRSKEKGEEV